MRAPSLLSLGLELAVSRRQVVVGVLSWSSCEILPLRLAKNREPQLSKHEASGCDRLKLGLHTI